MTGPTGATPAGGDSAAGAVLRYHELSKHRFDRYAPGPGLLDWANQPNPFRSFTGCPEVELPLLKEFGGTAYADLAVPDGVLPRPLTRETVGALLEVSLGLSAWKSHGDSRWSLRCNPSSGNLHPTECYLACGQIPGLAQGLYHYQSFHHALESRMAPGCPTWDAALGKHRLLLGLTSIHWREAWKYGVRAWRYCQHDTGHAVAALVYSAAALGWQTRLLGGPSDRQIERLLGLERGQDFAGAEPESPDALLLIGPRVDESDVDPEALARCAETGRWFGRANRLSAEQRIWPGIGEVAAAARKPQTPVPGSLARSPLPPRVPPPGATPAARLLFKQRRSAVGFDRKAVLSFDGFFGMLDALLWRAEAPPWSCLPWAPRLHPLLFVHRVQGLPPGLYLLPRRAESEPALRDAMKGDFLWQTPEGCPAHIPLRFLLGGETGAVARAIACHQAIAADSAFSLGMIAEFETALQGGGWWYRYLFWEAGVIGQVLYLEAEAAGLRGTGIGCYFDDGMHDLLGLDGFAWQDMYHFTVGNAVDDPRLATHPPYGHLVARKDEAGMPLNSSADREYP